MGKNKQKKHKTDDAAAPSSKVSRKKFERELAKLQVELVRLQNWVQAQKARIIVVFEGRDTAVKGGAVSQIIAGTSPRVFRHLAVRAPSDRENTRSSRRQAKSFSSTARGTIEQGSSR